MAKKITITSKLNNLGSTVIDGTIDITNSTVKTAVAGITGVEQELSAVVEARAFALSTNTRKRAPIQNRIDAELAKLENADLTMEQIEQVFENVEELQDKLSIF